jgi:hypothetical protein
MLTVFEGKSIGVTGRGISISDSSEGPRKFSQGWTEVGVMVGVGVRVGVRVGVGVDVLVGVGVDVLVCVGRGVAVSVGSDVIEFPVTGSRMGRSQAVNTQQVKYKNRS